MATKSPANQVIQSFTRRYPHLEFLLRFQSGGSCKQEVFDGLGELLSQKTPELILLRSLISLSNHKELFEYLKKNQEAKVVVFEPEISSFFDFFKEPYALDVIEHLQIEIRYVFDGKMQQAIQEAIFENPTDLVALFPEDEALSKSALYDATLSSSIQREDLYFNYLFRNLLKSSLKLHEAYVADALKGVFSQIPVIICGAGPSLDDSIEDLKELSKSAVIIAGGSTLTALSKKGVEVHLGFAVDPNPEEYDRLELCEFFELPLFFAPRLMPEVSYLFNGPRLYMKTGSGGEFEKSIEEELDLPKSSICTGLSEKALSVTTVAIAAAVNMGFEKIFICGVDLAFTKNQCYADGVLHDASIDIEALSKEKRAPDTLFKKGESLTLTKWLMESEAISSFAKSNKHAAFFDASEHGLGFEQIPKMSLKEAKEWYFKNRYDIKGFVHACVENLPRLSNKKEAIRKKLSTLYQSLIRLEGFELEKEKLKGQKSPQAKSKLLVLEMDIEEEISFCQLIEPVLSNSKSLNALELIREYLKLFELVNDK